MGVSVANGSLQSVGLIKIHLLYRHMVVYVVPGQILGRLGETAFQIYASVSIINYSLLSYLLTPIAEEPLLKQTKN